MDIEPLDENYDGPNDVSLSETPTPENIIPVSVELSPLEALKNEFEDKTGYSSDGNRIKALDQLSVFVTKANVGRALRFMDTLIKAIRARGHDIEVRNRETPS